MNNTEKEVCTFSMEDHIKYLGFAVCIWSLLHSVLYLFVFCFCSPLESKNNSYLTGHSRNRP